MRSYQNNTEDWNDFEFCFLKAVLFSCVFTLTVTQNCLLDTGLEDTEVFGFSLS